LDENHASKNLFDLAKVQMYEDKDAHFTLRNLSVHRAENEEDALNLLFIGDTNRVVSETPKNDASTRSHCIFVI
jgi:kinesin family protein 6/9